MNSWTPILLAVLLIGLLIPPATSSTVTEATDFCAAEGRVGRYAHASINKYYLCYLYAGQLLGQIYPCPGSTIFDSVLGMCV